MLYPDRAERELAQIATSEMIESANRLRSLKDGAFVNSIRNSLADNQIKKGGQIATADYRTDVLMTIFKNGGYAIPIKECFMLAEECLNDGAKKVELSRDIYIEALKKLRGEIKNDVAVISSSTAKSVAEVEKLSAAVRDFMMKMTSPEMERSIVNAERMASALDAISKLADSKITFAVLGNSKNADT